MTKHQADSKSGNLTGTIRDVVGLPPGDRTAHGAGRPARDPNVPHGGLTSDDPARRDGTPVSRNSGTDE
jgi:hypothetical protein